LNTLAAITAKKAGFRSLGETWADTTTSHAVAGAALRLANPCGISGEAKPVAQQDRRSAPPDGRDRI